MIRENGPGFAIFHYSTPVPGRSEAEGHDSMPWVPARAANHSMDCRGRGYTWMIQCAHMMQWVAMVAALPRETVVHKLAPLTPSTPETFILVHQPQHKRFSWPRSDSISSHGGGVATGPWTVLPGVTVTHMHMHTHSGHAHADLHRSQVKENNDRYQVATGRPIPKFFLSNLSFS